MDGEFKLLLNQFADERTIHRKREAFLVSIIVHLVVVILIILSPRLFPHGLFRRSPVYDLSNLDGAEKLSFLTLPKDYQKLLQRPKSPVISDKDRHIQGKSPVIDPKGLRAPYSVGDTKRPEDSTPKETPQEPAVASAANPPVRNLEPNSEESKDTSLQPPSETKSNLRDLFAGLQTPGSSIQSSLEQARQGGNYGYGGSGTGESLHHFDNRQPNFSVDQPTILSDTRGVDFGPWLRLIYFRVKDNWHAVIPELIRSGTQAKVVVIFDIRKNGRIENLQVVRSSGLPPYDRAAVSSLKLSEPFPNFPISFSGDRITLQFSYFYNIKL
jgi:TonB family protein